MNKAIFLDRDGVINHTVFRMGKPRAPYSFEEFSLIDGVAESIKAFKAAGYLIIVVTNQPDVSRGWVSRAQVDLINAHVKTCLPVDEIMACFHVDEDNCQCRKPRPGMLIEASKKWDIDLFQSFMVGDRLSDVEAGLKANCKTVLISESPLLTSEMRAHHQSSSLIEASDWILSFGTV
jgi:D-glycero-D-manno-heptose 1,7-bisphosphate phosphatase